MVLVMDKLWKDVSFGGCFGNLNSTSYGGSTGEHLQLYSHTWIFISARRGQIAGHMGKMKSSNWTDQTLLLVGLNQLLLQFFMSHILLPLLCHQKSWTTISYGYWYTLADLR